MSFIDLMSNDIWSEADIVRRTESMVYSVFSKEEEAILNRKATGASLGQYEMSPDEMADLQHYAQVTEEARQAGERARSDMSLLHQVFAVEKAMARLFLPVVMTEEGDQEMDQSLDTQEREEAQAVIDNASEEVMEIVLMRNPPVVEEEEQDG